MYIRIILLPILLAITAGIIGFLVVKMRENKEYMHCIQAAYKIIQEEYLDAAIHNQESMEDGKRLMIYLKILHTQAKDGYVFDPGVELIIGRNSKECQLCLKDITVSGKHCRIFCQQNVLLIQDLASANGTAIQRGRSFIQISSGSVMQLYDRDKIYVGNVGIILKTFYFDTMQI